MYNLDRRAFLAAAGSAATLGATGGAQAQPRSPLDVQFFTFNTFSNTGSWDKFSEAMEAARRIGYDGIEFAGTFGHRPDAVRKRADELGLRLRSCHLGNDIVRAFTVPNAAQGPGGITDAQDAAYTPIGVVQICRVGLGMARDLGVTYAGIGATGRSNFTSLANVRRLGEAFNKCAELARQNGLKFFYHNHAVDLTPVEGRIPYEVFLEETDPGVRFQFDTGWAASAGIDPVPILRKYASRIDLVHLRDANAQRHAVAPGDGLLNFAQIRAAARDLKDPIFIMEGSGRPQPEALAEAGRAYAHLGKFGWGGRTAA